ncbi:MAG: glycosyltransferase family 2 protein [Calditrichaeota bacterium]|nr:MAG: glycosyltransferase family 2 protein [Calditrichota bacterium]
MSRSRKKTSPPEIEVLTREVPLPDTENNSEKFVSIIIPAYNEEGAIDNQLKRIENVMSKTEWKYEIIVVDDGSRDGTVQEALKHDVILLQQPENRGYGAALKKGISHARAEKVLIIDADGTYPAEAIPDLLEKSAHYDMVVGARVGDNVEIPWARRPAKWFLRKLASYLAEYPIPDLNSGLRVMNKEAVKHFYHILPSGFSFTTTITLAFFSNDLLVHYHPIEYAKRIGKSKIKPTDAYHFLLLILRTIVFFNPLRVFLPMGMFFFVLGMGKFIYDLFIGNLSETAVMGFLAAFIIWAIGLLSDQISRVGLGGKQ